MTYDEYNTFVLTFVDQNEYPVRDNPLLFNESIRLQINEILSDKHLNMFLKSYLLFHYNIFLDAIYDN